MFEYAQCLFQKENDCTGRSAISEKTGGILGFTLETNYFRGHHSAEPFTPAAWLGLGNACLETLVDLDLLADLEGSPSDNTASVDSQEDPRRFFIEHDLARAAAWLAKADPASPFTVLEPSRACPQFAMIRGPSEDFNPSPELWPHVECFGEVFELIGKRTSAAGDVRYKVEMAGSSLWVQDRDLAMQDSMLGRFFYRAVLDTPMTDGPEPESQVVRVLSTGTVLQASERRVIQGQLRVRVSNSVKGLLETGWASEHQSIAFDPRLGGKVQLMRLRALPGSKADCLST